MSSIGAALGAAFVSSVRAEASRSNGRKGREGVGAPLPNRPLRKSRGPKTPEGKARSAKNALEHGLRAERFTVVGDEDEDDYDAHEQALLEELAPEGALQSILAERIARAAWRLARADTIEAMLFDRLADTSDLGLALIRDGHGRQGVLGRAWLPVRRLVRRTERRGAPTPF